MLAAAAGPASAQAVYKCGKGAYSQAPCSRSLVSTAEAPIPVNPKAHERARTSATGVRRLPGESDEAFARRFHRAKLRETDRDECARLDTKIPFERERAASPDGTEAAQGVDALAAGRRRYRALRC